MPIRLTEEKGSQSLNHTATAASATRAMRVASSGIWGSGLDSNYGDQEVLKVMAKENRGCVEIAIVGGGRQGHD